MSGDALTQILVPVTVFSAVVVALALLVLAARHWLAPSGRVEVLLNGRTRLDVAAGDRLLWALAEQAVYLPAACGGRGTCGQCRVVVERGAEALLPTEVAHIGRRDAARGVRLACMTVVRDALAISVPEDLLAARRWRCRVESNRSITTFLKELVLAMPDGQRIEFEAGDYVLLEATPHRVRFADFDIPAQYRDDWRRYQLMGLESVSAETLVRAYSLANAPSDAGRIVLVVRIATPPPGAPGTPPGVVSSFVFGLRPGDSVAISGPFGTFHARDTEKDMVLIAGGAGIAPIRSLVLDQLERSTGRKLGLWYGVRNVKELCYHEELTALAAAHDNFTYMAALSERAPDDWPGPTGFIHDVVRARYLAPHPAPEEAEYYLCGPPVMSAAVLQTLDDFGVEPDNIFFDDFGS